MPSPTSDVEAGASRRLRRSLVNIFEAPVPGRNCGRLRCRYRPAEVSRPPPKKISWRSGAALRAAYLVARTSRSQPFRATLVLRGGWPRLADSRTSRELFVTDQWRDQWQDRYAIQTEGDGRASGSRRLEEEVKLARMTPLCSARERNIGRLERSKSVFASAEGNETCSPPSRVLRHSGRCLLKQINCTAQHCHRQPSQFFLTRAPGSAWLLSKTLRLRFPGNELEKQC